MKADGRILKRDFIATVVLRSNGTATNAERRKVLLEVVEKVAAATDQDGIILLPGGYYSAGERQENTLFNSVEKEISDGTYRNTDI